jgi:hypothetical protein
MKKYFQYPTRNMGFHSAWTEDNDDPTQKLTLSFRKFVNLEKPEWSSQLLKGRKIKNALLFKSPNGSITGLSDGAGSSLLKTNSRVYKIKRNGYKEGGIIEQHFRDNHLYQRDGRILESTYFEHAGLYPVDDALHEIKISERLESLGFLIPHKPIALYGLDLNLGNDAYGALICDVISAFRCDEFIMSSMMACLRDQLLVGEIEFDMDDEFFSFKNFDISKALKDLKRSPNIRTLENLFHNIGVTYKELHKRNHTRGMGNAWCGNEILYPDGKVGLCDFDSTFHQDELPDPDLFEHLKNNDLNLFHTGLYSSLAAFNSCLFDALSDILLSSFRQGYQRGTIEPITSQEIEDTTRIYLNTLDDLVL